MSCYHPLIGIDTGEKTANGKKKIKIVKLEKNDKYSSIKDSGCILIPCGHCIGCRLDYSRRWADRMMLELDECKKAIFITLTYDNEHAHWSQFYEDDSPMFATLDKRDCQLFMKNLRERYKDIRIRFYLAGEYGEKTLRPHYHAIIFGISLDDISDKRQFGRNELGQPYYLSNNLSNVWKRGNVLVADVSWETCAYVARYVTKKLNGDKEISYAERNVIKEFALMSRKPGIGASYLEKHPDCLDYNYINLMTDKKGLKISIPKYFIKKLELIDKEKYDNIILSRKRFAEDKMLLKLKNTDLGFANYLDMLEQDKLDDIKKLKRK